MTAIPQVGPRILIPSSFPASKSFLEVRRVGQYPQDAFYAVLYGYIEYALALKSLELIQRLERLLRDEAINVPIIGMHIQRLKLDVETQKRSTFLDELDNLDAFTKVVVSNRRLETTNDYTVIHKSFKVCEELKIKASLFFAQISLSQSELSETYLTESSGEEGVKLNICADEGKIYLLYTNLTEDSFVQVSCGHLMLRYELLDCMKRSAGCYAFGETDLREWQLPCQLCQAPLHVTDLVQVLPPTANSPPRQLTAVSSGSFQCNVCNRGSSNGITCSTCSHFTCANCVIIRSLTNFGPVCGWCNGDFLELLNTSWEMQNYPWLQRAMDIAAAGYRKQRLAQSQTRAQEGTNVWESGSKPEVTPKPQSTSLRMNAPSPPPVSIPASHRKPSTGVSGRAKTGAECQKCGLAIDRSSGDFLCKNHCRCFGCELQDHYYSYPPRKSCGYCLKNYEERSTGLTSCLGCNQANSIQDLFYWCLKCRVRCCLKCAKKNKQSVLVCSTTGDKHPLNEKKAFLLLKEDKECRTF